MSPSRVLITTSWLDETDDAYRVLREAGHEVQFARPADLAAQGRTLAQAVEGAQGIVAGVEPFDAEVLEASPTLRVVARTGVGYDNVDVEVATARGVAVAATPGVNRQSVAEFAIAAMLNLVRSIPASNSAVQEGRWPQPSGRELHGKTLGIVGFGAIGRSVAILARAFGMSVVAYDPYFDEAFAREHGVVAASLPDVIAGCDMLTLHVFLDESTHHLINESSIATMRDGAIIVNAARGGVVDEDALVAALRSGKLAGALLDTFEQEPLQADSPLRGVDGLLLTSHIAGATIEGRQRSGVMAAEAVVGVLAGEMPRQIVNREALANAVV